MILHQGAETLSEVVAEILCDKGLSLDGQEAENGPEMVSLCRAFTLRGSYRGRNQHPFQRPSSDLGLGHDIGCQGIDTVP